MTERSEPRMPRPGAAVAAIALNTFREAIRDRVLYLLLVFALVLIGTSSLLALLTVGDEEKIIKDVGLSAISIFGLLTAVFVGVSLVFKEIERRTVYTLLAHPVRRWQFIAGKFLGLFAVLGLNLALMSAALFALLVLRGVAPGPLLPAVLLVLVELAVVSAFALLFSSVANPMLAAVATVAVYVMGHLSWSLRLLEAKLPPGAARWLCELVYWLVPNLSRLDVKAQAVHGLPLAASQVAFALGYGVAYVVFVLPLACAAFPRRDFQ
jgi:ABC-type Na+ efflux pump permease subunit